MKIKTLQLPKVEARQSSTRLLKKNVFATMTLLFFGIQATYAEVGDIFVSRTAENIPMKFCVTDEENKECTVYGESIGVLQYNTAIANTTKGAITIPATARDYKVTSISAGAFFQCRNITSVSIPEGITSIGLYAFGSCMGLTTVNIPSTVKKIDSSFTGCILLERVDITDLTAWTKIDFDNYGYGNPLSDHTGSYSSNSRTTLYVNDEPVYDLVIPEGVTEIKSHAFRGYGKLASVTIPTSVQTIKTSAFDGCNFTLKVESTTPPKLQDDGNNDLRNSALVIVPEGTKDIYRNAEGWRDLAFIVDKDVAGYAIRFISEHGTLKVTCSDGEPYDDFFIVKPGSDITVEATSERGYTPKGYPFEDNQTQGTFYGIDANQEININYRLYDATNVWNGQEMKLDALVQSGLGTTWIDGTFESCNGFHNDGNLRMSPYNKNQLFAVYDQEPYFGTVANGIQLIDLEAQTVKTILPASMFYGRRLRTIDFSKDPFAYDAQGTLQGRAPENWESNATAEQLRWRDHLIIACDNNANGYNSDVVYMVSRDGNGEFSNNSPVKVIAAYNNCNSAMIHPVSGDLYFTSYEGIVFRLDMQKYWDSVLSGEEWNPKASENDDSIRPGFEKVYTTTSYSQEMQIYFHPSGKYAYLVTVNDNRISKVYYADDHNIRWSEVVMPIRGWDFYDSENSYSGDGYVNRPYQGCFVRNSAYAELGMDDEYDFFFADSRNNAIRYLRPDGSLYTALGATEENTDAHNTMTIKGDAYTFNRPTGLIYDEQEEVFYVIDTNNGALLKLSKSDTTGIDQAPRQLSREEMSQDTSVYDMQGRKVSDNSASLSGNSGNSWFSSKKGIYIVNGRKVIVK